MLEMLSIARDTDMWREIIFLSATLTSVVGCGEATEVGALPIQATVKISDVIVREDVRFECGSTVCAAWLYLPASSQPPPVVVMAHGFAGTRDVALPFFAESFARSGIAALVFDYRHFGASGGSPRQLVDPWQQLDDWASAIRFAREHPKLDGTRLGLWGTSLGGGLALIAATTDRNISAVVAQAPQIDSDVEGEASFPGVGWAARLLFTGWADLAWSSISDEPWTIPAIAPSNSFGMIEDDAAYAAFSRIASTQSLYRNEVAARSIFTFDDYNPRVQAAALRAPVLLIASKTDRFASFAAAESYAKAHDNVDLVTADGDHFDIYLPPRNRTASEKATAFLQAQLLHRAR